MAMILGLTVASTLLQLPLAAEVGGGGGLGLVVRRRRRHEYCQFETFNASCAPGSLVFIESGEYGRMSLGRCLDTDVFIGCSADVVSHLDLRCSGRPNCAITIPDSELHQQQPCPSDMMAYLETAFSCIEVDGLEASECPESGVLQVVRSDGYLSSYSAHAYGHGTSVCPWQITVKAGQRLDVHLVDFSLGTRYHIDHRSPQQQQQRQMASIVSHAEHCFVFLTITEATKQSSVCAGTRREQRVYSSQSNSLTISISDHLSRDDSINFIVRYSAVGCPDLAIPSNAWLRRTNNTITIGCNHTTHTWHLVCKQTTWIGQPASDCLPGLLAAVVVGIVIGAVFGLFILAAVFWCKIRMTGSWFPVGCGLAMDPARNGNPHRNGYPHRQSPFKEQRVPGEYGYTQVWELSTEAPLLVRPKSGTTAAAHQPMQRSHLASAAAVASSSPYRLFSDGDVDVIRQMERRFYDVGATVEDDVTQTTKNATNETTTKCFCVDDAMKLLYGRRSPLHPHPLHPPHPTILNNIQIYEATEEKLNSST